MTENGFTPVSPAELINFVDGEGDLPEKPVLIVFDDGYTSNYEIAYPILRKYNAKAAICMIGQSVGCSTYKDTGFEIIPYFTWEQAKEMEESGLISMGSHTYDMHQTDWLEGENDDLRISAAKREDESVENYRAAFTADHDKISKEMKKELGHDPLFFAYPLGKWTAEAEEILTEKGIRMTFITDSFVNTVTRGDESSLRLMGRYNMNEETDLAKILGIK